MILIPRTWGWRFSSADAVVLTVALAGAVSLLVVEPLLAQLLLIVLGHFFLFCNVFRIHRRLELLWAGLFLGNSAVWWLGFEIYSWLGVLAVQMPITALLIVWEMCQPRYHGILARRINPRLDAYLSGVVS